MIALLKVAGSEGATVAIPAGVAAQAWRGGAHQTRIARLLDAAARHDRAAGRSWRPIHGRCLRPGRGERHRRRLGGRLRRERGHAVVTSDPDDLRAIDPKLESLQPN